MERERGDLIDAACVLELARVEAGTAAEEVVNLEGIDVVREAGDEEANAVCGGIDVVREAGDEEANAVCGGERWRSAVGKKPMTKRPKRFWWGTATARTVVISFGLWDFTLLY
ncbi:hypothetical protein RHGRI_000627 [Rhododendron griersonianum]|uniref:Uncharacterized protein n=1 Tax=Rhododendron griersonianum TaxID=479676 RepID=A0AAV6LKL4_9ERIC|nr:hypothetical protein RHGRI_000627 [Rhododendron griersonianum]